MILKIATKVNKNGNQYGLVIDTDKKTYNCGYFVCGFGIDIHASKTEIKQLIGYTLKPDGYKPIIKL